MIWGSQNPPGEPDYFGFDLLRKYIVVFGKTFADIVIQRTTSNNVITNIKVPLQYAPKDKMIARLEADPDIDRPFSALLPVISFEIAPPGIVYDAPRNIPNLNKWVQRNSTDKNHFQILYSAAPYDIHFNVYIYMKNQEDGAKIIEQILPFFKPDWTPTVELIPEMNVTHDIPIEMVPGMGYEDKYDGDFKQRRMLTYTIPFKMRAYFYGPVRNKPMIKFGNINTRAGSMTRNDMATINYTLANKPFVVNQDVSTYFANGFVQGTGTVRQSSFLSSNNSQGTIVIENVIGNLNANIIYGSSNTITAHVSGANGFSNGIYDQDGNFLPNAPIADSVYFQATLTANGYPTQFVNNSVSVTTIDVNDDYGFAQQVQPGSIP